MQSYRSIEEHPDAAAGGPRGTRSIVVASRIRDMIVSGELPAGSRIAERNLIEQRGSSRTPLREAFKILEVEGLVTIEPNRGATVARLSLADVEAAIELLVHLEGLAAELACKRASDEEIEAIRVLHERMMVAFEARDLMSYFHINQSIHESIVDCAHNPVLSRVYRGESARIHRVRYAGNMQMERWARAVYEHEQLLDALTRREHAILREMLRAHHLSAWKVTRRMLEIELDGAGGDAAT